MNTVNDTQLALVAQLTELNAKLSQFINGDADTIVATEAGPIKSLAGIVRDLNKFRYVQKIIEHRLYSDVLADDVNIDVGLLVRVYGDTDAVNGLYKKLDTASYAKVSYAVLNDLLPPTP